MTPERITYLRAKVQEYANEYHLKVWPYTSELAAIERRALDIVDRGSRISGYPRKGSQEASVDRIGLKTVTIRTEEYIGCGEYKTKYLKFPTRWLALSDSVWQQELAGELEATKRRKAEHIDKQAHLAHQQAEARDRAVYESLKARFER